MGRTALSPDSEGLYNIQLNVVNVFRPRSCKKGVSAFSENHYLFVLIMPSLIYNSFITINILCWNVWSYHANNFLWAVKKHSHELWEHNGIFVGNVLTTNLKWPIKWSHYLWKVHSDKANRLIISTINHNGEKLERNPCSIQLHCVKCLVPLICHFVGERECQS